MFTRGAGHYWDFDGRHRLAHRLGRGGRLRRHDPLDPVPRQHAPTPQGTQRRRLNDFILHNSMRPNAEAVRPSAPPRIANGNVLLVTEEDYADDGDELICDRAGSFQTWYVPDLDGAAYRTRTPTADAGVGTDRAARQA